MAKIIPCFLRKDVVYFPGAGERRSCGEVFAEGVLLDSGLSAAAADGGGTLRGLPQIPFRGGAEVQGGALLFDPLPETGAAEVRGLRRADHGKICGLHIGGGEETQTQPPLLPADALFRLRTARADKAASDCEREAIRSTEEAELLLEKVRKTLEALLGEPVENSFRFRMVSYPELLKVADLRVNDTAIELGLCHASFSERRSGNKREIVKIETEILMLDHLPRRRFLEIAAHELAHHWQYHAAPYLRDRVMQEGFAEYMASLVNREFGQENLNARIEQRRDPVYGAGFRKIRSVARREGIEGVKKMLRDAGKNAAGASR